MKQEKLIEYEEMKPVEQQYWKPTTDSEIKGKIIKQQKSKFGMSYVLETTDGNFVLPNHVVLDSLLSMCEIGDNVKITCTGSVKNKTGNNTQLYKLFKGK
jgi:hypothetical protein